MMKMKKLPTIVSIYLHLYSSKLLNACTPSTRHRKLAEGNCKGGIINNEVADFPQLYSFCNVLPNSIVSIAPELEGLSMKKQHLLLQQSHRKRQQMCPKSKTSDKVCKIVTVDLNALASSKLRVLLPVLPSRDDAQKESNEHSKISKSLSAATNLSSTVEQSIDGRNKISMNDSVYGYKAIVLKKITEEGLKDLLENGSKSKLTATVTYKYKNKTVVFVVKHGKIYGTLEDSVLGRFFLRPCPYNQDCSILVQKRLMVKRVSVQR